MLDPKLEFVDLQTRSVNVEDSFSYSIYRSHGTLEASQKSLSMKKIEHNGIGVEKSAWIASRINLG